METPLPTPTEPIVVPERQQAVVAEIQALVNHAASASREAIRQSAKAQTEAIVEVEAELQKSRSLLENDKAARRVTSEAQASSDLKKMSPLGMRRVIDERNELRMQLRETAAQMVRTQRLWEIELNLARNAPIAEITGKLLDALKRAQTQVTNNVRADQQQDHEKHHEHKQKEAQYMRDVQNEMRRATEASELEISTLRQNLVDTRAQVQTLQKQAMVLAAECESIRSGAETNLAFQMEQQDQQHKTQMAIELTNMKRELTRDYEEDTMQQLAALQAKLEQKYADDLAFQKQKLDTFFKARLGEMKQQARKARDLAVQDVIEHFRGSHVAGLEEQRSIYEAATKARTGNKSARGSTSTSHGFGDAFGH